MFKQKEIIVRKIAHLERMRAYQSRLAASISNLETTSMNLQASRSRILDTDYAKETTDLAKSQIIAQAATAMLAQANQSGQSVLTSSRICKPIAVLPSRWADGHAAAFFGRRRKGRSDCLTSARCARRSPKQKR